MKLHEYQAKMLFAQYGIPIPKGLVCTTPNEAKESIAVIGYGPWIVKCQVHAGGRGKSGGVRIVRSKEEIQEFAKQWFGKHLITEQTNHIGQPVSKILVEAAIDIAQELYLGCLVDRSNQCIKFIASIQGGIDIENIAKEKPHLLHQIILDPLIGPQLYQSRDLAFKIGLSSKKQINQFNKIFMGLATLFLEKDLVMAEINPLVITRLGDLICLDGKLHVDSNALFRQPELCKMLDPSQEDKCETYAKQHNLNYIALNGNIGCLVNGAGLAMSTIDMVKFYGGEPANFLDVGGRVTQEKVTKAFQIILSDKKVKVILVNIFGGIVCCDVIAKGIINARLESGINIPVIVRLEGNNAKQGIQHLVNSILNIRIATNLTTAAKQAVALVEGKQCLF